MPVRAETVQRYVQWMHQSWVLDKAKRTLGHAPAIALIGSIFFAVACARFRKTLAQMA